MASGHLTIGVSFAGVVALQQLFIKEETTPTFASSGVHLAYLLLIVVPAYMTLANRGFDLAAVLVLAHCAAGLASNPSFMMVWVVIIAMGFKAMAWLIRLARGRLGRVEPSKDGHALITGASSGIGREIARDLARRGFNTILVGRNAKALQALAEELGESSKKSSKRNHHRIIIQDLATPGAAAHVMEQVGSRRIDFLVNSAGFAKVSDYDEQDLKDINGMVMVNCLAIAELCRLVVPGMKQQGAGRILNISSIVAFTPTQYAVLYEATKSFVYTFSNALQYELQPYGVGVTVSIPGSTDTEFAERSGTQQAVCFTVVRPLGLVDKPDAVARQSVDAALNGEVARIPNGLWAVATRMVEYVPIPVTQAFAQLCWLGHA